MSESLARYEQTNGTLARPEDVQGGYQPMRPLDVYARGLADEAPRVDAIATISCGRLVPNPQKPGEMIPRAARKDDPQWIYIHDQNDLAPGLTQALQETNGRRLTIAFPWDDPSLFIQQRFALYSQSALRAYGDEKQITVIEVSGSGRDEKVRHVTYMARSKEYEHWVSQCKVSVSVYFALARWGENNQPQVIFPDGLGMYRLRFTSRHTLRNFLATIDETARMTNGRIAGIPFDLFVDFRQVAGPNGRKRDIPVFSLRMRPPFVLTSDTFRSTATAALKAGSLLQLPPPPARETWETAVMDGPVGDDAIDATDEQVERLARGGRCNKAYWTTRWFALVKGTSLGTSEGRKAFLMAYTGDIGSLSLFLDQASEDDAAALLAEAQDELLERGEIEVTEEAEPECPAIPRPLADGNAEYKRLMEAQGEDLTESAADTIIETESREVTDQPVEALDELREEIDAMLGDSVPGYAELPTNPDADEAESEIDYGRCMEAWEAYPNLGMPKPLARAKPAVYQSWWAAFQGKLKEAQAR